MIADETYTILQKCNNYLISYFRTILDKWSTCYLKYLFLSQVKYIYFYKSITIYYTCFILILFCNVIYSSDCKI